MNTRFSDQMQTKVPMFRHSIKCKRKYRCFDTLHVLKVAVLLMKSLSKKQQSAMKFLLKSIK